MIGAVGMRAVTWQGTREVRVNTVPDPTPEEATDGNVRVRSTGMCGVLANADGAVTIVEEP